MGVSLGDRSGDPLGAGVAGTPGQLRGRDCGLWMSEAATNAMLGKAFGDFEAECLSRRARRFRRGPHFPVSRTGGCRGRVGGIFPRRFGRDRVGVIVQQCGAHFAQTHFGEIV